MVPNFRHLGDAIFDVTHSKHRARRLGHLLRRLPHRRVPQQHDERLLRRSAVRPLRKSKEPDSDPSRSVRVVS